MILTLLNIAKNPLICSFNIQTQQKSDKIHIDQRYWKENFSTDHSIQYKHLINYQITFDIFKNPTAMNAWKHNTKQSELLVQVKPQTKASTIKIQDKKFFLHLEHCNTTANIH